MKEYMNRRGFIGGVSAMGIVSGCRMLDGFQRSTGEPVVRFGMVADPHYADIPEQWGRNYRGSLAKMEAAVRSFEERECDFIIELGDLKDLTIDREHTLSALDKIEKIFTSFKGPAYHICGNHDFDCLTESEFYGHIRNNGVKPKRGYYSFDRGGLRFIVLDACYTKDMKHYTRSNPWTDANVPPEELEWLKRELARANGPAVVFVHQLLDPAAEEGHLIGNHAEVRRLLVESGKVKTVITGHQHSGRSAILDGILHYTLPAEVEGDENPHAVVSVFADGSVSIENLNSPEVN